MGAVLAVWRVVVEVVTFWKNVSGLSFTLVSIHHASRLPFVPLMAVTVALVVVFASQLFC